MAQDSCIIHSVLGTITAHGLGGGAVFLIIERDGENLSIALDPEEARKLSRYLMWDLADQRAAAERATEAAASAAPQPAHINGTAAPSARPVQPDPLALPAARAKRTAAQRSGTINYRAIAPVFMKSGIDDYVSKRVGKKGRKAYVADHFGISYTQAGARIVRARQLGHIPSTFQARMGQAPRPRELTSEPSSNGAVV